MSMVKYKNKLYVYEGTIEAVNHRRRHLTNATPISGEYVQDGRVVTLTDLSGALVAELKARRFPFFSDPAHGWCRVPVKWLHRLGIADRISCFSYVRKDFVYVEEDSDLDTFCIAMAAAGYYVDFNEQPPANRSSKIRSYDRWEG